MGGQRALIAILLLGGCNLEGVSPVDAGAGERDASVSDLSALHWGDDLPTAVDLASGVDLRHPACPLPCTGNCTHPCRSDGGVREPDLVAEWFRADWVAVGDGYAPLLTVCVANHGEDFSPAVPVTFRSDQNPWPAWGPEVVGTVWLNLNLDPGDGAEVSFVMTDANSHEGSCSAWAVVDDLGTHSGNGGRPAPTTSECDTTNNKSESADTHTCGPM